MAANKQASTYVNTLPQCSPASVGLAQAHPNYLIYYICTQSIRRSDLSCVYSADSRG